MDDLIESILDANERIKAVDGGVRETPLDEASVFSKRTGATFLSSVNTYSARAASSYEGP